MQPELVQRLTAGLAVLIALAVVGLITDEWVWFALALAGQLAAAAVVLPAAFREQAEERE